ncbi:MAG: hypothetical protein II929_02560, partial [Succinivibrio sp.]|nr:hypothetical protein [Succinivibrio sp.]
MADLRTSESTGYDNLFAGLNRDEIKTFPVTVASGQNLKRGALVKMVDGKVSAVGSTSVAESGSGSAAAYDEVFGIMTDDVNASAGDADGVVYVTGDFNKDAIVLAEGLSVS